MVPEIQWNIKRRGACQGADPEACWPSPDLNERCCQRDGCSATLARFARAHCHPFVFLQFAKAILNQAHFAGLFVKGFRKVANGFWRDGRRDTLCNRIQSASNARSANMRLAVKPPKRSGAWPGIRGHSAPLRILHRLAWIIRRGSRPVWPVCYKVPRQKGSTNSYGHRLAYVRSRLLAIVCNLASVVR